MTNLRKYARGQHCTVRLPGCNAGPDNETVVLAHAPCVDKAMSKKSPDWWAAWCCHSCHDILDGRKSGGLMPKEVKQAWLSAIYETQKALCDANVKLW